MVPTPIEELVKGRNRNLGAMFCAEFAFDYLRILFVLLDFRRNHELEVLRDDLFAALLQSGPLSCNGEPYDGPRFDAELDQLVAWGLLVKRLEKTRLRSYKDVRRDRFRYRLEEETVAFLLWLEERHENDLLPREDDSVDLLEFIVGALKQLNRTLRSASVPFASVVFALGDIEEKTLRLSQRISAVSVRLGDFLLRTYTVEEAEEVVEGLGDYFKNYLRQLNRLRLLLLQELAKVESPASRATIAGCFERFAAEQASRPRIMRVGSSRLSSDEILDRLHDYYRRDGRVDQLCGAVHSNALRVLAKLTSYLKELQRRSNRLEFIDLRLQDLAAQGEDFEPVSFLRDFLGSCAAPLDMNDSDEFQKAEPPAPRSAGGKTRLPPRLFVRTAPLAEKHVETHEEMRLRRLGEFLAARYPGDGPLDGARLRRGESRELALLMKYGFLGGGARLAKLGKELAVDPETEKTIAGEDGALTGPAAVLRNGDDR